MQFPTSIETERLVLRPWRESDAAACYRYASDPRIGLMCGWKPHESEDESREIIRTVLSAAMQYAVTLRGEDEAIGSIGFHPCGRPEAIGHMELGYWLGEAHWGNGYIPEAAAAMLQTAFDLGATELWVAHFAENHNSRRVIHKLGFTFRFADKEWFEQIGEEKEVWYYSMLPEDFQSGE